MSALSVHSILFGVINVSVTVVVLFLFFGRPIYPIVPHVFPHHVYECQLFSLK